MTNYDTFEEETYDDLEPVAGEEYWGSKDEEMDEEGRTVDEENKPVRPLCANCLEQPWTQAIKGSHLCDACAKQYPEGMPF